MIKNDINWEHLTVYFEIHGSQYVPSVFVYDQNTKLLVKRVVNKLDKLKTLINFDTTCNIGLHPHSTLNPVWLLHNPAHYSPSAFSQITQIRQQSSRKSKSDMMKAAHNKHYSRTSFEVKMWKVKVTKSANMHISYTQQMD